MIVEAAAQPCEFTARFEIIVSGIRTVNTDNLTDVVKQVDWVMKGSENGQTYELPQKTLLSPPDETNFISLESITTTTVFIEWIQITDTRLAGIKSRIQSALSKLIEEAGHTNIRNHPGLTIPN